MSGFKELVDTVDKRLALLDDIKRFRPDQGGSWQGTLGTITNS
jgi:hypothetical protein